MADEPNALLRALEYVSPYYADQARNSWNRLMNVGAGGLLPPEVRERGKNAMLLAGELSPGAGVRDLLGSSGDLTRSAMNLEPMNMLAAAGGMGLGAVGAIPGSRVAARGVDVDQMKRLSISDLIARAEPGNVFVRWSAGPKYDMAPGAASIDKITGTKHPGLSVRALEPGMNEQRAAQIIEEYGYLRQNADSIAPHFYEGKVVGKDSDGYPALRPTKYLGGLSPDDLARIDNDLSGARRREIKDQLAGIEWSKKIAIQGGRDAHDIERTAEQLRAELRRLEGTTK